jgi:hypothetical protein
MDGVATSFLSPTDTDILYDLKEFLQQTKQVVPHELASHEAAQVKPGIEQNGSVLLFCFFCPFFMISIFFSGLIIYV